MARLPFGGIVTIAQGALTSSPIEAMERPLAWISLPTGWPADTLVTLQGAITTEAPAAGSTDWMDIANMIGRPITFLGPAGQIMALEEGTFVGAAAIARNVHGAATIRGHPSVTF